MGSLKPIGNRVVLVFLLGIIILSIGSVRGKADSRINPLRFGVSQKSWQLTLNLSRYVDRLKIHTGSAEGLWEEVKTIYGTSYQLQSSFDLNERIGFRGGVSYRTDSIKTEAINLWTGSRKTSKGTSNRFGGASFKVKVGIWENSELKTYFLIPVLGGPAGVGLVWSRDPVMVFPKFSITGDGFDLNTGVSFVANTKIAITRKMSFSQEEDSSAVGLG